MKLKEWDWDNQCYIEREYPDEPIKAFVDFMCNNNQWMCSRKNEEFSIFIMGIFNYFNKLFNYITMDMVI